MSVRKQASSSMATPCSSVNVAEQFLVTDWTSLVSMDQNMDFNSTIVADQFPRHSSFINDDGSFDLLKSSQISSALSPQDMHFTNKHSTERSFKGKKRKSVSDSPMDRVRNVEDEQQRNVSPESVKSPTEASGSPGGGAHNPTAKHANENPQDGDACKEDYIHVRAKRGQATNSHSLAERVRREKISERMRLLQDLVPGCNKITGKAMMLDEIINYVQSLQRQVEFLSMKLAAVNPELHFDVDQILSKDILQSRDRSLAAFECAPGMSTFHPHFHGSSPQGIMQPGMAMSDVHNSGGMMRSTIPLGSPMAQIPSVWDDELQTVLQMGFIPNPPLVGSELNGSMKMEL